MVCCSNYNVHQGICWTLEKDTYTVYSVYNNNILQYTRCTAYIKCTILLLRDHFSKRVKFQVFCGFSLKLTNGLATDTVDGWIHQVRRFSSTIHPKFISIVVHYSNGKYTASGIRRPPNLKTAHLFNACTIHTHYSFTCIEVVIIISYLIKDSRTRTYCLR